MNAMGTQKDKEDPISFTVHVYIHVTYVIVGCIFVAIITMVLD